MSVPLRAAHLLGARAWRCACPPAAEAAPRACCRRRGTPTRRRQRQTRSCASEPLRMAPRVSSQVQAAAAASNAPCSTLYGDSRYSISAVCFKQMPSKPTRCGQLARTTLTMAPWRSTPASAASRELPGLRIVACWRQKRAQQSNAGQQHARDSVKHRRRMALPQRMQRRVQLKPALPVRPTAMNRVAEAYLTHLWASGGMACRPRRRTSRAEAAGARCTGGGASAAPCAVLRRPSGAMLAPAPGASRAATAWGLSSSTYFCFTLPARSKTQRRRAKHRLLKRTRRR